ncbi:MAG: helix-turn-helix domain-containing protein [Longibaculum muris]|uniref:HxlR family transcriptional regulator n=2 Tax=Longibaculum muris TaxID=1796628 RepID=A0A4R3Z7H3_9FIRM|nr:helix-turn-helix domain-containing protein [Longibaculum muris]KXU50717.1 transcriptional regulator, HxlR family [Candidatus Stoquefichus sp. KLE1796]MBS5368551.1 helix-turn-helix transcriptional regulator [Coprobacillus cateniformis]MCR1887349.1 helix-turn-helix transcriptional regulator [Longibaculum muris]MED9812270.1 helix-turn-helix domain-containing protein [Longibaculum muris]TCW02078.1 HxlR family transcriptional regulator [Longibaculum muris]
MKKQYDIECNIAQTLNLIGDKWTLLILHAIQSGYTTYKELQENLPGIPTNLLSNRLKTLCEDDLLKCELYSQHPPRYQYSLTDKSKDLDDIYNALIIWGDRHLSRSYKCLKHKDCDGQIQIVYVCQKCGKQLTKDELIVHNHSN